MVMVDDDYEPVSRDLESCIFCEKKTIVGPKEAQYLQFLLPWTMTHYILRSTFFWATWPPLYGCMAI